MSVGHSPSWPTRHSKRYWRFRITDTSGGDARNLPRMLDQALDRLGIPLEDRGTEPAVSVDVDDTPADENTVETITEYVCDCGCCKPVARERRVSKVKKPPVAILRGDGGYDSREAFSHCRKRGVRTTIRIVMTIKNAKTRDRPKDIDRLSSPRPPCQRRYW